MSDLTFAKALMRIGPLGARKSRSAYGLRPLQPSRFIRASRYEGDRSTQASPRSAYLATREPSYGYVSGVDRGGHARVWHVFRDSPAYAAGVRRGDLIRTIDGVRPEQFWADPTAARRAAGTDSGESINLRPRHDYWIGARGHARAAGRIRTLSVGRRHREGHRGRPPRGRLYRALAFSWRSRRRVRESGEATSGAGYRGTGVGF